MIIYRCGEQTHGCKGGRRVGLMEQTEGMRDVELIRYVNTALSELQ